MELSNQSSETVAASVLAICSTIAVIIRFIEKRNDERKRRKRYEADKQKHFKE